MHITHIQLFQTTKIQTFESNSQPRPYGYLRPSRCFRLQRYKLLKAIHNLGGCRSPTTPLFQTTKIQTFESNSQRPRSSVHPRRGCFRLQRYKLLKAIHNSTLLFINKKLVVSDYKDTNFWKQFTTMQGTVLCFAQLFQTTKIQTFESNSQQFIKSIKKSWRCFRLQRYKLLKAIHNIGIICSVGSRVVSDYKDTNFWKQFTTICPLRNCTSALFQTTKIQTFESNSQQVSIVGWR